MNPNAVPFQSMIPARPFQEPRHTLEQALNAPFAPVQMLTSAQKERMHIQPSLFDNNLTYPDLLAVLTCVSAVKFVLE